MKILAWICQKISGYFDKNIWVFWGAKIPTVSVVRIQPDLKYLYLVLVFLAKYPLYLFDGYRGQYQAVSVSEYLLKGIPASSTSSAPSTPSLRGMRGHTGYSLPYRGAGVSVAESTVPPPPKGPRLDQWVS